MANGSINSETEKWKLKTRTWKWKMGDGRWKMEAGRWNMEIENWKMEIENWEMASGTRQVESQHLSPLPKPFSTFRETKEA